MASKALYKTKPLESWRKAKELRLDFYREIAESRSPGAAKLLISGGTESFIALPAGLGDYVFFGGEPYAASLAASDPKFALECQEAVEAKHMARDACAYMRNYLGSLLLDRYLFGGPFPRADLLLQTHICDTHAKWYQIVRELEGIPYFAVDFVPLRWEETEEGKRQKIDYLSTQLLDAIEWMEQSTGRAYQDDLLIEAVENECLSTALWAECCMLNQATPATMDEKSMYSLYIIAVLMRHRRESVEFYRMLLDELKDRVADQIAAVPTERCRILHDSQPPWHALHIFRYLERYGAVAVGSNYDFGLSGGWYFKEGELLRPATPPMVRGVAFRTREDAVRAMAGWWLGHNLVVRGLRFSGPGKNALMVQMAREWHCDGAMIHLNRGCEGAAMGQMEARLALAQAGFPVMTYEGNMADPGEFDEARTLARIDTFMESMGLRML
ncbi:MAG TPA: benzoyl-CoA reductase, bzd-type, subunit O [Dehalococcoidia bacterium]|nr:benzoyl-CoA reductase, bzd-type, subunit O [Dehalococcoidia bacterium]